MGCLLRQQVEYGRGGFFDRAAGDINDWTIQFRAQVLHEDDFVGDAARVGIFALAGFSQGKEAVAANLGDAFGVGNQANDKGSLEIAKLLRDCDLRNDGNIGGADAALSEIDAGRCFRGATYAEQHDICLTQTVKVLAVVMGHRVIESVDALKIFGVQRVLAPDLRGAFGIEILCEALENWIEDGDAGNGKAVAMELQGVAEIFVDDCKKDNAWFSFDGGQDFGELLGRPHQRVDVFDGAVIGIVGGCSPGDSVERFPCRVRNEMQVEEAGVGWSGAHELWTNC